MGKLAVISRNEDGTYSATIWWGDAPVAWAREEFPVLLRQLRGIGIAVAGDPLVGVLRGARLDVRRVPLSEHQPAGGDTKRLGQILERL